MNTYTDWDKAYLEDDVCGMSKAEWRAKLAADTETFIANGGEIEYLPYDPLPEIMARVGRWEPMGRDELEDLSDLSDES